MIRANTPKEVYHPLSTVSLKHGGPAPSDLLCRAAVLQSPTQSVDDATFVKGSALLPLTSHFRRIGLRSATAHCRHRLHPHQCFHFHFRVPSERRICAVQRHHATTHFHVEH